MALGQTLESSCLVISQSPRQPLELRLSLLLRSAPLCAGLPHGSLPPCPARCSPVLGWEIVSGSGRMLDELTGQLGATVRRGRADWLRGLYVIIDPQVTGGRDPLTIAQAAIQGGARMLQPRDKLRDKGESLPLARELQTL